MHRLIRSAFLALLFVTLFCVSKVEARGADMFTPQKVKIEGVYFFGYEGFDLNKLADAFSLKNGAIVDEEVWFPKQMEELKEEVAKIAGKPATDVALIHTGEGHIVFVGIPGKSNSEPTSFHNPGKEKIPAPAQVKEAYFQSMSLLPKAVAKKNKEDVDAYLQQRKVLLESAKAERAALLKALESADTEDRVVASYALGLVASTKEELAGLVKLADDPNSTVRNNSTRELAELLLDKPELAKDIPPTRYIEMLNSPTWTDRNKAVFILQGLSKTREPSILAEMREKALPSLKEMCTWPIGYSDSAIELLGRIAGIPDEKLKKLQETNNSKAVFEALEKQQ